MAACSEHNGIFTLTDTELAHAPIDRCFRLTCSVELVRQDLGMRPVSGRTHGLVAPDDTVRWEGWQLGMRHFHVSHISAFQEPQLLQDTMLAGRFRTFQHDHHLREVAGGGTELHDELRFSLPFGGAGRLVARAILVPHIQRLLRNRLVRIRSLAEGSGWRQYLSGENPQGTSPHLTAQKLPGRSKGDEGSTRV